MLEASWLHLDLIWVELGKNTGVKHISWLSLLTFVIDSIADVKYR